MEATKEPSGSGPAHLAGETSRTSLFVLFGTAALVRLVAVFSIPWQPTFDDAWYFRTAREIAEGRGYLDDLQRVTAYFPVGYPATLAAFSLVTGPSLLAAQLLNVVFALGTLLCIYLTVRTLGGDDKLAATATALFGFLPNQVVSCCVTMSEITFTFAITLGTLLALQPRALRQPAWWLLVGAVFGWATLIRSQALLLPLMFMPIAAYYRLGWNGFGRRVTIGLGLVSLGLGLVVGPWTYRNYRELNAFVLVSTNGGENLFIGNNPVANGRYQAPAEIFPQGKAVLDLPELERDRLGRELAREYIESHPLATLARAPKKLWYMYRSDLGVTNWILGANGLYRSLLYYPIQSVTEIAYLVVLGSGMLWLLLAYRRTKMDVDAKLIHAVTLASVLYFSAITLVFFGDARFHQPLLPGLAICAAYLFTSLRWPPTRRSTATLP